MRVVTHMILALAFSGCATAPISRPVAHPQAIPALQGSYHHVHPGETLWRIARLYGVDVETLVSVNRLPSPSQLRVGQRLLIPLPRESSQFLWPVIGTPARSGLSTGLEIAAPVGSLVRASRSGHVAVATRQLLGLGKTIVIDHRDGFLSVYADLEQLFVGPGVVIRQGTPVGSLGPRALYFEIRRGMTSQDPLALLPSVN